LSPFVDNENACAKTFCRALLDQHIRLMLGIAQVNLTRFQYKTALINFQPYYGLVNN